MDQQPIVNSEGHEYHHHEHDHHHEHHDHHDHHHDHHHEHHTHHDKHRAAVEPPPQVNIQELLSSKIAELEFGQSKEDEEERKIGMVVWNYFHRIK